MCDHWGGGERVTVCRDHQLPCQHVLPTHTERHRHTNRHYLSLWSGVSPAVCNYSQMDENHLLLGEIKKLVRPFFFSFFLLPFNYSLFHWGMFPEKRQRDRLIKSRILLFKLAICFLCFWIKKATAWQIRATFWGAVASVLFCIVNYKWQKMWKAFTHNEKTKRELQQVIFQPLI